MPNFFSQHKKIIFSSCLILLISFLGIFVFGAEEAKAGLLIDFSFDVIAKAISVIGVIIHSIVSLIFWLASMTLEMAFGLEKFTDAPVVELGWKITRDLTNMLFVLILLGIALATILRLETYGMKQILLKLVVAALLINFSLVLAGVVIDFCQVLTHFFYDEIKGTTGVSAQIAGILNIQRIPAMNPDAAAAEKLAAGTAGVIMMIFSIFLGIVLILAASLVVGIGAFFLIVRLIAIWILLILAPIVWLLWIIPATSHLFKQWWDSFLKWSFFAPIYAFFIYLAIKTGKSGFTEIIQDEMENIVNASGWKETMWSMAMSTPSLFLQFLAILGLLLGGLVVAQKMSIYGAEGAMKFAKGIGKGASVWAGRRAQIATARPAAAIGRGLQKALGRIPIARQLARPPRAFAERERAALVEAEKKYTGWTSEHLKSQYKAVDPRNKAAIVKILAGRGDFKKDEKLGFAENDVKDAIKITKRYEQHKDVLKARPDLAGLAGENIEKIVSELKPADLDKFQTEALASDEVIKSIQNQLTKEDGKWGSAHLSKMAEINPKIRVEIQQQVINKADREPFRQSIETYLNSDAGKAIFGKAGIKQPEAEKEKTLKELYG